MLTYPSLIMLNSLALLSFGACIANIAVTARLVGPVRSTFQSANDIPPINCPLNVPGEHVPTEQMGDSGPVEPSGAPPVAPSEKDPPPLGPPLYNARRTAWFRGGGLAVLAATVAGAIAILVQHRYPQLNTPANLGALPRTQPASLPKAIAADIKNLDRNLALRGFGDSHRVVAAYGAPGTHRIVLLAAGEPAATSTNSLQHAVVRQSSVALTAISKSGVSYRCGHSSVTSLCVWRDGKMDGVLLAVPALSNGGTARLAAIADRALLRH